MKGTHHWLVAAALVLMIGFAGKAFAQPNLAPYQPPGWSDSLVVTRTVGSTTDSAGLTTSDSLYADLAVANYGNASTGVGFYVYLYLDGQLFDFWYSDPLDVFYYVYVTDEPLGKLSAGPHSVEVVADPDNEVAESNESDNSYTKNFTVIGGQPDLTRSTDSISKTNLFGGDAITVSVTIQNQSCTNGDAAAGAFHVGWYFSTNASFTGASAFFETAVAGCAADSNVTFSQGFNLGNTVASGTYYLGYKIDDENELSECSKANNGIFSFTLHVTAVADLSPQNIIVSPVPVPPGGSATVSYAITNSGGAASAPSHTRVRITDTASNVVVQQTFATAGIAAGSFTNESHSLSLSSASPGLYYASVSVDVSNEAGQASNTNNDSAGPAQFEVGTLAGLIIVPTFDSSITSDPQAATIEATINSAIAVYESSYSDPITVNITFQEMSTGLGQSSSYLATVAYSDYYAALSAHATTTDDATALAHLPNSASNPVNGNSQILLKTPLARALGFSANPPGGAPDGVIGLKTSIMNLSSSQNNGSKYSLFSTVSHEIDEVLGMGSALDIVKNGSENLSGAVEPEDLFRYDGTGARNYTTNSSATAYFSLDGTTDIAQFNQVASGDFGDWYSFFGGQTPQVQDAFGTPGSAPTLGAELRVLDAIGYTFVGSKTNQTITFGSLPNRALGEPPFAVSATASSGLPVSFSILSGPATLSSGTNVAITGLGAVTVRASQPGNANYNAAPTVDQSFTVYSPPAMTQARPNGTNLMLTWSTNVPGFSLLTTTNLTISNSWVLAVPAPVISGNVFSFTNNTLSGTRFYRLKK
jgi:hypothetical protein